MIGCEVARLRGTTCVAAAYYNSDVETKEQVQLFHKTRFQNGLQRIRNQMDVAVAQGCYTFSYSHNGDLVQLQLANLSSKSRCLIHSVLIFSPTRRKTLALPDHLSVSDINMDPNEPYYYGCLTSLYPTVSAEIVNYLEQVLWANRTTSYEKALSIFEEHLKSHLDKPVVLFELADLHFSNFRYKALYDLLDPKLSRLKTESPKTLDEPIWRLLLLIHGTAVNRGRGEMEPAVIQLKRTKQWLAELPVSEYTDVHVQCASKYAIAYLFTRLQGGILDGDTADYEKIPRPDRSPGSPWQGLGDLRKELVKQSRIKEASTILRVELNRAPSKQRLAIGEEFIEAVQRLDHPKQKKYRIALVQLQMADASVELHDIPRAKEHVQFSIDALDQWCVDVGLDESHDLPFRLEIEEAQLSFIANAEERFREAVELANRMETLGHSDFSRCIGFAAEAADKASELTGNMDYRNHCYTLRERQMHYNENVAGELCNVAVQSSQLHTLSHRSTVDMQKSVEWIDGFFEKYPYFQAPRMMHSLYMRKGILLLTLQDMEGFTLAMEEVAKWEERCGSSKGVTTSNRSNVVAPGNGAIGEAPYDSEEDNDDEDGFLHGYGDFYEGGQIPRVLTTGEFVAGDRTPRVLIGKLTGFAADDIAAGRLSIAEVCMLFDIPQRPLGSDEAGYKEPSSNGTAFLQREWTYEDLEQRLSVVAEPNPEQAFRNLWLPKSEEDEDKSYDKRYNFVRIWLQKPVRGSRDRRLMCLLRFIDHRRTLASNSAFRKLAIGDDENLLSLWETLPRMLKEFSSNWQWAWHANIAWNLFSLFINGGQWTLFDNFGYLIEIDKRCDIAVEGFRKSDQLTALANIQRLQAQVCILTLRRLTIYLTLLRQSSKTVVEEKAIEMSAELFGDVESAEALIPEARQTGLKLLAEADDILSNMEREAFWEEGLGGIQKRSNLRALYTSHETTKYAIRLLTDGVEDFPEATRIAVWDFIQNYKARLLTLAIGMHRPTPPSLLQKIQDSAEERPMYQKMVELLKEIEAARPSDRFFLRRRLDEHRKKMKEHGLLRELMSLREGIPLSLDDLEQIGSELDEGVVLVDWYYLESFWDAGKLLMTTARKGSPPTLDVLPVNVAAIQRWKQEYLDSSSWVDIDGVRREPKLKSGYARVTFNETCGSIVGPLEKRTRPGETLVLCPTDFLNGLPLHALNIDEEAIIRRNPCVYIPSHSLLRPCLSATQFAMDQATHINPTFISGIGGTGKDAEKFSHGRESIMQLSTRLGGKSLMDESATKEDVLKQAKVSRLLHVQTHCKWDSRNPLDHHIEFPMREGDKQETLSARDVFELELQQGSHVNVIACSGALTDVKAGDEVMGLVPALLYSGATSVVSTLWPIYDEYGARFSKVFFDSFIRQRREAKGNLVNMARAVQEGVMALDPKQNEALIFWAPFVMNGYWMFATPRFV